MICTACGTANAIDAGPRGSGLIEIVLWLTFIIPIALVYSIWRRAGVKPRCAACGGSLVGLQTPAGRRLAAQHYPDGALPPVAGPVRAPAATTRGVGRLLLLLGAAVVGVFVLALVAGPLTA